MSDPTVIDTGVTSDIDPFSDEFLEDPFPFLAELRELAPVVYLRRYGVWSVARHQEVEEVLRDYDTFTSAAGAGIDNLLTGDAWREPSILLEVDPPIHTVNRRVVSRAVAPSALRVLRETFEATADALAADLASRRKFDVVTDLAEVFPTKVFPEAMGVTGDDVKENLLAFASVIFNGQGPKNAHFLGAVGCAQQVMPWVAQHCARNALRPGGLGARLYEAVDAGEVSEEDASLLMRAFLAAGIDTTVSSIALGIQAFLQFPDQWQLLRSDPSLAKSAFEEIVRRESPVIGFFRTTTRDTEVAGCPIPASAKVLVFFAGANRDPQRWDDPDSFDIQRKSAGHMGFGTGVHACVGQSIARMEGEILLRSLAAKIESWRPAGEATVRHCNTLRALAALPVEVTPAS
jgi:cytochrome P450